MAARLNAAWARRCGLMAGLVGAVITGHGCVAEQLARHAQGLSMAQAMPPRMEVRYVREMALAPVLATAPVRTPAPQRAASRAQRRAAPVGALTAPDPSPAVETVPPEPAVVAPDPAPVAQVPEQAASAPELAASAPAYEWPGSTRLSYRLTGHYGGEVNGQAQVEWVRVGTHYQVHVDVSVGLSFAPWVSRRMSSDGEITPEGLAPRRYDQVTKLAFSDPYRAVMRFGAEHVRLATGETVPRVPGTQDTASQFVQLSWMLDKHPERLRVGHVMEIPLALPRSLSPWVYDVVAEEWLYTDFGEVQAFHLKPRRVARAGGDMTTEIWVAPQLRHLPVRFRIHQDAETYIDLLLEKRPELGAP